MYGLKNTNILGASLECHMELSFLVETYYNKNPMTGTFQNTNHRVLKFKSLVSKENLL